MAIPVQTRIIDDAFTSTWQKIKAEMVDNILDSNVVTAALRAGGCFVPQMGGYDVTETIGYGTKSTKNVKKGDTLGSGETELSTMARWDLKTITSHIQRSFQDDRANKGEYQIADLVARKTKAAKDAIDTTVESTFLSLPDASADLNADEIKAMRAERDPNSLWNIMPGTTTQGAASNYSGSASYEFGKIGLDNSWWQAKYNTAGVTDPELNLLSDMRTLFNTISDNLKSPNLVVTNQTMFEYYEDFAQDMTQIIKDSGNHLADLGYNVLKFKGQDMVWTKGIVTNRLMFLDRDSIKVVYDPDNWFEMTEWKNVQLQLERIAHILAVMQVTCDQPRRNGWLGTYA
jgi:hypothetical protein